MKRKRQCRQWERVSACFLLVVLLALIVSSCAKTGTTAGTTPGGGTDSGSIDFTQVSMINEQVGWATTSSSVLKTADGGKTWTDVTPTDWEPLQSSGSATATTAIQGIISARFLDANHAWIVASTKIPDDASDNLQPAANQVTVEANGTVTTNTQDMKPVVTQVYVRSTADGGLNWVTSNALSVNNLATTSQPDFINPHEGWLEIIGQDVKNNTINGVIYHSLNGGITWSVDKPQTVMDSTGGSLDCLVCYMSESAEDAYTSSAIKSSSLLTGLTVTLNCTGQSCSSSSQDSATGQLGCTIQPATDYAGWATGTDSSSNLLLSWRPGANSLWHTLRDLAVPGGTPQQSGSSVAVTEPIIPFSGGGGVLPVEVQSDPAGSDPSHFFLHLYLLAQSSGNYTLSNFSPTSPFSLALNSGAHSIAAPDAGHIFVVGQDYNNGEYGDWNLYEFDGAHWNKLNSQTDATIKVPTDGSQASLFSESLGNLDFISPTEGWATNGTSLYHITIGGGTAHWSQIYPASNSGSSGSTTNTSDPTRAPGAVIAAPKNPGACGGQSTPPSQKIVNNGGGGSSNAQSHVVTFVNNTGQTIWVGAGGTAIENGDWNGEMASGSTDHLTVKTPTSNLWSGRFWARTGCDQNGSNCATGDCGEGGLCEGRTGVLPATLAEFAFNADRGLIFYDGSLVDGYNVPLLIRSSQGDGPDNCGDHACADLNQSCPTKLQLKDGSGQVIGCKSACTAYGEAQYCCTGTYGPGVCNPDTWPSDIDSAKFFKTAYPHDYSYAYDDSTSTYTCEESCSFTITFGLKS